MTIEQLFIASALVCGASFLLSKAKIGGDFVGFTSMMSLILTVLLGMACIARFLVRA